MNTDYWLETQKSLSRHYNGVNLDQKSAELEKPKSDGGEPNKLQQPDSQSDEPPIIRISDGIPSPEFQAEARARREASCINHCKPAPVSPKSAIPATYNGWYSNQLPPKPEPPACFHPSPIYPGGQLPGALHMTEEQFDSLAALRAPPPQKHAHYLPEDCGKRLRFGLDD